MRPLRTAPARRLSASLLAGAMLLAGCGGSSDPSAGEGAGVGLGVPLRRATCADWKGADAQRRLAVLAQLRTLRSDQITGRGVRGEGTVLNDDLAFDLFENRCALPNSDSYLLYKLYSFAAGFAGVRP